MRRLALLLPLVVLLAVAAAPAPAVAATKSKAATAPTRVIDVGPVKLGYRSIGRGKPIVFIQGLGGAIDAWDPRFLDAVAAQGRRVIVFDNEGSGRSGMRPGELSMRDMADDAALLIRALKLKRADVFGWSMGGMIAQSLAIRHPARVRRLALIATAPGDGVLTPPTQRGLDAIASKDSAAAALDLLFPPNADAARDAYVANVRLRRNPKPVASPKAIDAHRQASGIWLSGQDEQGKRIRSLRMPVMVAGGGLDELLPVENQRHIAQVIPGAKLLVYEDSSHAFFYERRRDFLPKLDRFLG